MRQTLLCLFLAVLWNLSFAGKSKRDNDYERCHKQGETDDVKMKIPNGRFEVKTQIKLSNIRLLEASPNVLIKRVFFFVITVSVA